MARPEAFNADRNLYRSKDGSKIVEEGDPEALTLAYAVGDAVDAETARANALTPRTAKSDAAPEAAPAEAEPEHKRAAAAEDKARKAPQEDKGA